MKQMQFAKILTYVVSTWFYSNEWYDMIYFFHTYRILLGAW